MTRARRKLGYFALEALNAFATAYYFNYLFFLLRDEFHLGDRDRLWIAAGHGLLYVPFAWLGGKFAQKRGYFAAMLLGCAGMAAVLLAGMFFPSLTSQMLVLGVWTFALCFTWPAIEALVADGEDDHTLPRMIGLYNVVWALAAGVGYFLGGALFERLGRASLYWLPAAIHVIQCVMLLRLKDRHIAAPPAPPVHDPKHQPEAAAFQQPVRPEVFLKLAWLANPLAYMALNALLPLVPTLASKHGLSTTASGFFFSIWFLVRVAAFYVLWQWTGWHYKFRWLIGSYIALVLSFLGIVLAPNLLLVALGQVVFGSAAALIYYSSLFYAMDVSEDKGEHGGAHEALLGMGIFGGPALSAAALQFAPAYPLAGVITLGVLMAMGGAGLVAVRNRGKLKAQN